MNYLPCIELEPASPATAAVIWLHGLGASGDDFAPIVPELRLPADLTIRFVLPHAPMQPVTINGGMIMPSWYDIISIDVDRKFNAGQLKMSANSVVDLIEREISRGIPSERIVLAGFSQGGAVAFEAALSFAKPLAGLLALSTYFATEHSVVVNPANNALKTFVFHGKLDDVVPELLGRRAVSALERMGFEPEYRTYPMYHEVCFEEIEDISNCLRQCLGAT